MTEPKSWLDKLLADDEKIRVRAEKEQQRQEAAAQRRSIREGLLQVHATQELFSRQPGTWEDNFDLDQLDCLSDLPEVNGVWDWEADFFQKRPLALRRDSADELLIAKITRVEERLQKEAERKRERRERAKARALERKAQQAAEALKQVLTDQALARIIQAESPQEPSPRPVLGEAGTVESTPTRLTPTNGAKPGPTRQNPSGTVRPRGTLPRTCPRCRGSMILERDWYGVYSTCLSCGYVHEAISTPPIDIEEEEERPRQRRRQPSHGKMRL